MIFGLDLEMAMAPMARSVRQVDPSTVVVGRGIHDSSLSADFQSR